MNSTPVSLLRRVSGGTDPRAWDQFVEVLLPLLWEWVGRLRMAEQDAADLIQDVFLVLFKELPGFEYNPARSFRAWLWTILKRRATDRFRKARPQTLESDAAIAVEDIPLLEETEFRETLIAQVMLLIKTEFPETTWRAFQEHCLQNRPVEDVAADLGISPGSVYVAKGRVLKLVRERLQDMLD